MSYNFNQMNKFNFIVWCMMRTAAEFRHRWVHSVFEGGNPQAWSAHEEMIKRFYGY